MKFTLKEMIVEAFGLAKEEAVKYNIAYRDPSNLYLTVPEIVDYCRRLFGVQSVNYSNVAGVMHSNFVDTRYLAEPLHVYRDDFDKVIITQYKLK